MIYQRALGILDAVRNAMEEKFEAGGYDAFCLLTLLPGEQVPFDYCSRCDCGMAWVRLVSLQPPEEQLDSRIETRCFTELSMTIEVGHVFGAPWPDADGDLPEPEDHRAAALRQLDSADIMLQSLLCTELPDDEVVTRPTYTPIGPDGGCLGGAWSATVRVI